MLYFPQYYSCKSRINRPSMISIGFATKSNGWQTCHCHPPKFYCGSLWRLWLCANFHYHFLCFWYWDNWFVHFLMVVVVLYIEHIRRNKIKSISDINSEKKKRFFDINNDMRRLTLQVMTHQIYFSYEDTLSIIVPVID